MIILFSSQLESASLGYQTSTQSRESLDVEIIFLFSYGLFDPVDIGFGHFRVNSWKVFHATLVGAKRNDAHKGPMRDWRTFSNLPHQWTSCDIIKNNIVGDFLCNGEVFLPLSPVL